MTSQEFFDGLAEAFEALRTGEHWGGPHSHDIEEMINRLSEERKAAAFAVMSEGVGALKIELALKDTVADPKKFHANHMRGFKSAIKPQFIEKEDTP